MTSHPHGGTSSDDPPPPHTRVHTSAPTLSPHPLPLGPQSRSWGPRGAISPYWLVVQLHGDAWLGVPGAFLPLSSSTHIPPSLSLLLLLSLHSDTRTLLLHILMLLQSGQHQLR
jgi:hypothetical protein